MANPKKYFPFSSLVDSAIFLVVGLLFLFQCLHVKGQEHVRSRNEAHVLEFERDSNFDAYQNQTQDEDEAHGENSISNRQSRYWALFRRTSSSSSNNAACVSSNGRQGVCRSRKSCTNSRGVVISNSCGNKGTNVCCLARATCSASNNGRAIPINSTGTHLLPPAMYTAPIECRYEIPQRTGVCQVKLDFITFEMAQPSNASESIGSCVDDALTIAGSDNLNNFQICGKNKGQHLYLHYGSSNMISVTARLQSTGKPAVYDILVTYINCAGTGSQSGTRTKGKRSVRRFSSNSNSNSDADDPDAGMDSVTAVTPLTAEAAPSGCTQYFTKSSDTVQSFNYEQVSDVANNGVQYQLNNQMYTVCVKANTGTKLITWKTCTDGAFVVTGALPTELAQSQTCPTDYVDVPGGSKGARFCGTSFPGPVTSALKPFMLAVNFDDVELLGPNYEINPMTGCCIFCQCVDGNTNLPPLPPVAGPCKAPNVCQLNDNLVDRVDMNNIGFCLSYTVS